MAEQSASRSERQGTHYEGCWRDPRHHGCAVAYIEHLTAVRSEQGTRNAARYEWLRSTFKMSVGTWKECGRNDVFTGMRGDELDAAIDAAMSSERPERP